VAGRDGVFVFEEDGRGMLYVCSELRDIQRNHVQGVHVQRRGGQ
jgi:hypothetical protein